MRILSKTESGLVIDCALFSDLDFESGVVELFLGRMVDVSCNVHKELLAHLSLYLRLVFHVALLAYPFLQ